MKHKIKAIIVLMLTIASIFILYTLIFNHELSQTVADWLKERSLEQVVYVLIGGSLGYLSSVMGGILKGMDEASKE